MLVIPRSLEYFFVCFALWFFIGNPINLINSGGGGQLVDIHTENSNFLLPAISMATYAASVALLTFRWKLTLTRLTSTRQMILLAVFLSILCVSFSWSFYPSITIRRSILLVGSTAFAVYFSSSFTFKEQLRLLTIALCVNVLICIIFGILVPKYGLMPAGDVHAGSWRGVHTHKNKLGAQMALTTVFLLATQYSNLFIKKWNTVIKVAILMSVFMVVGSRSTTALFASFTLTLTYIICSALRLTYRQMVISISSLVLIIGSASIYFQTNADEILGLFGKTTDLTGRGDIWPAVFHMVAKKPVLGYGYQGFWGLHGGPADLLRQIAGWPVPNAHNGFLEVLLAAGYLGSFFFFASLLITLVTAIKMVRTSNRTYSIFPVLVLVFLVLSNMTESTIFVHDSWTLYIWSTLSSTSILATFQKEKLEDSNSSVAVSPPLSVPST